MNVECWNCDKTGHMKKNCRTPKKNEEWNNGSANIMIEEVQDALLLAVDSHIDS